MLQGERLRKVAWPFTSAPRRAAAEVSQAESVIDHRPAELQAGSAILEACRTLRANLAPGMITPPPPPLLVVGAASDRACALTAAGLALVLAEERPTLLVDADLRQPVLHTLFSIDLGPGLASVLEQPDATPMPVLVDSMLWVLPAGSTDRNPADLFRLPSVAQLKAWTAERYEAVVFHAPGGWATSDALLLAAHIHAGVLVIRAGLDPAEHVRRVKESLERAGVDLLGFALLDV